MAGESDEPDEAAARLEAALERIAAAAERRVSAPASVATRAVDTQAVATRRRDRRAPRNSRRGWTG